MSQPERIRFCLACGEAMPFADATCPACGAAQPAAAAAVDPELQPCRSCAHAFDVARLFCPRCGAERRAAPVLPMPRAVPSEAGGRLPSLAAALTLLGPIVLLAAALAAYART